MSEALEAKLQEEIKRRLEAEVRLARVVFALSGEALVGDEIDRWLEVWIARKAFADKCFMETLNHAATLRSHTESEASNPSEDLGSDSQEQSPS